MTRVRITVRGDDPRVELRGYMDVEDFERLGQFSDLMKPYGIVVASFAEDDYDPFVTWQEPPPLVAAAIREWADDVLVRASMRGDVESIKGAQTILDILDRGQV